jgi:two-component sensor histidine kinase
MTCVAGPDATSLLLVEEFAHRVLNEYAQAIAGLNLAARHSGDQAARRQLIEAANRLGAHAHAHRALAMPAVEAQCDVAEYMTRVCSALANPVLSELSLQLKLATSDAVAPSDRCWRLALIVSELIHNAARHAGRHGEVVVELSSVGPELICRVSNCRVREGAPKVGRGRRVVTALARELGGRADWLFTPTVACAWVIVPLEAPTAVELP